MLRRLVDPTYNWVQNWKQTSNQKSNQKSNQEGGKQDGKEMNTSAQNTSNKNCLKFVAARASKPGRHWAASPHLITVQENIVFSFAELLFFLPLFEWAAESTYWAA